MLKKKLNLSINTLDILNKFCFLSVYTKPSLKKVKLVFFTTKNENVLQNKVNLIVTFFLFFFKEAYLNLKKNVASNNNIEKNIIPSSLFYEIILTRQQQIHMFLDLFLFHIFFGFADFEIKKSIKKSFFRAKLINVSLESFFEVSSFSKFLDLKNTKVEVSLWFTNTNPILKGYPFFLLF